MKKNIIILVFILFLVSSFLLGLFLGEKKQKTNCLLDLKKTVEENGYFSDTLNNAPVTSLSGTVLEVFADHLLVKFNPVSPFSSPTLNERNVLISNNSTIYKIVSKAEDEYNMEMNEYLEKIKAENFSPESSIVPPLAFIKDKINLNNLKVGSRIDVFSSEDVKEKKEFIAKEIILK
ncbi:MAG: hypothetical protein PF572_06625 [Patescibacteria group bacterium]|jgi:hypothetical protein|nr:hypothetical protein [Patescibacteria group bacterium]